MHQQRSPRFRTIRTLGAVAVLALGGTALAVAPAGAATVDGATTGCQPQDWGERYLTGLVQPSRLWVNLPTSTAANATTYVRYHFGDGRQSLVSQWYRSTTGQLLPNPYGGYAAGTREWYNQAGQKLRGLSDTIAYIRPGARVSVVQEKVVLQNGRFSASRYDIVGAAQC